jgi:Flp pilus assembly protein TadG
MTRFCCGPRPPFWREEKGSTAAEFALLSFLFVGMMLGIIDMARYAWELNSAKAAARAGARLAVVSPIVSTYLAGYDALAAGAVTGNGEAVPASAVPLFTCSASSATPPVVTCANSGGKSTAGDATTFSKIVTRMKKYYPRAASANVSIEYRHVGLGVSGNPFAPDVEPLITVKLVGLQFRPLALRLLGNITFNIPAVRSTLSGESLGSS